MRLLEAGRKFLLGFIKENSTAFLRTYSRVARRTYLNYIKFRKARRTVKNKLHGQMLRFVKRNLRQAELLVNKSVHAIDKNLLERIETIKALITQQEELRRKTPRNGSRAGIHIKDRIVSIYKSHVRPIPRGKIPVATEFGAKILLELRGGVLSLMKTTFNNLADSDMLREFLPRYKGLNLGADRGFDAPRNTKAAKDAAIKNYCIEKKGNHNRRLDSAKVKRMRKQRSAIEAKISLAKRKYGLDKNLYGRGETGEMQWIRLGLCAMNLKFALREV
jgi:transposase, IS5 family